jgi:hypothetical protein
MVNNTHTPPFVFKRPSTSVGHDLVDAVLNMGGSGEGKGDGSGTGNDAAS